jgi:hypothetical protein
MIDNKTLQHMIRHPHKMIDFHLSGRTPALADPQSPLITLLLSIPPAERRLITAVKVGQALGYTSQNTFQNVSQALNWLKPSYSAESYPSQSHQNKRFTTPLTIDDLAECANVPEMIKESWWRNNPRARRRQQDHEPGF